MKKKLVILLTGIIAGSCSTPIDFDDYDYQSIYFSYQSPVRTLVLGDEVVGDNTIDREYAFNIGVTMGGAYENTKDRVVTLEYAPQLGANVANEFGDTMEILPESYYDAAFGEVVIPEGEFGGRMRVDLTDAFFADPLSTTTHYFIPVRIASSDGDTILRGEPGDFIEDPDPRVAEDWKVVPKDYTLFGIKYINETHGMYLLRGARTNTSNGEVTTYSERFLTDNTMAMLTTHSLNESILSTLGGTFTGNELFRILLKFNTDDQTITISSMAGSVNASGSGVYFTKDDDGSESYNGQKHRTIYLDYSFTRGVTYDVKDTLVFSDTDVMFEKFIPVILEP
jgi:hypothetical protein